MINWRRPTEVEPVFYTFTSRADFDEYVKACPDIYLADLPSRILGGHLVLCTDPIIVKCKTYNIVGAWFDIDQGPYTDDNGPYYARPWGFVSVVSRTGFRSRHRSSSWQDIAALRAKMIATAGAVVDYRGKRDHTR